MKKLLTTLLLSLLICTPALAEDIKNITLKDGSVLKGKVVSMANGVYTIATDTVGKIKIEEEKVQSIADGTLTADTSALPANVAKQMEALQLDIMSDPAMMEQIQALMNNESIMKLIEDPNLMKDLMTMDEATIMGNSNIQQLLNNPQMQNIISTVEQKYAPTPAE